MPIIYKETFWCKIGIHDWYLGCYITGFKSQYTGDHVGRTERHCLECGKKELSTSSYSKANETSLRVLSGGKKKSKWIPLTNKVDILTKKWIKDSGAIRL